MGSLLQVQGLTVCYGAGRQRILTALRDVSLELAAGEVVGILGESGCGKTTLALALLGLLPKTGSVRSGSIIFEGSDLMAIREREFEMVRGSRLSLVHQEPGLALNPVLRVGGQVAEVLRAHQKINSKQARERSKELLSLVGLAADSGIADAFPHQLSGGQRQRVAIAQAIACHPALIIADEPTTALDVAIAGEIIALLQSLQQKLGMALLLISHDPAVLAPIAQRILVMYAGKVVEVGPAHQVLDQPLHPYTKGLLECGWTSEAQGRRDGPLGSLAGEAPNLAALPAGCAFAPRCPDRMDVCLSSTPVETNPDKARQVWCFKYD